MAPFGVRERNCFAAIPARHTFLPLVEADLVRVKISPDKPEILIIEIRNPWKIEEFDEALGLRKRRGYPNQFLLEKGARITNSDGQELIIWWVDEDEKDRRSGFGVLALPESFSIIEREGRLYSAGIVDSLKSGGFSEGGLVLGITPDNQENWEISYFLRVVKLERLSSLEGIKLAEAWLEVLGVKDQNEFRQLVKKLGINPDRNLTLVKFYLEGEVQDEITLKPQAG
jgi:hypothetical protein